MRTQDARQPTGFPSQRQRCYDCFRPRSDCFCDKIPVIDNRTDVLILQHTRERFHAFNTARIVRKALTNSRLLVGHAKELAEAKELMTTGDKEAARTKFEEAIAARPDLLEAYARLAELTYGIGDMDSALAAARGCLDKAPESIQCLAIAINASGELGDEASRDKYMVLYQKLNPDDPTILFNEAAVLLNNLDDEGARPFLERCLAAAPDFPECNFEYGMLLLRSGNMEGAKTHLQKYLEIVPDGPLASTAEETIKYL